MRSIKYQVSSIKKRPHERGFTILLAALVAALVLALGISVFSVAQKQLILSSTGRNSQYAFYTADTAAECALYWDMQHSAFDPATTTSSLSCDTETAINVTHVTVAEGRDEFTFQFNPNGYCADVIVTKSTVHPRTTIHADGFSVNCVDVETSARVLQRSVELTY